MINKSVVKVDSNDFLFSVVQLKPFKSEYSAQVTSITIVVDENNIHLYDGDGTLLSQFDLSESARGKPLQIIKPPNAGDLLFGVLFENESEDILRPHGCGEKLYILRMLYNLSRS